MPEAEILPFDVSRETRERLKTYASSLKHWTRAINLISATTIDEIWGRHILDSAQIIPLAPETAANWCDLGSGAGLPGIVVAILARERHPDMKMALVESDARKAAFLMLQIKALGLNARVVQGRIESAPEMGADVVTARALAPLTRLLGYSVRHGGPRATSIFLKGKGFQSEIERAAERFSFDLQIHKSVSDPAGAVLVLGNLKEKETER